MRATRAARLTQIRSRARVLAMHGLLWMLPVIAFAADTASAPARFEGVASCASSLCHGSARPLSVHDVLQNEYVTWSQFDPHSNAYRVLLEARSRQIAERMGIGPAHKAPQCLACHAEVVSAARRGARLQLSDGVGCESCHGAAERWLPTHHQSPAVSHADNLARGLIALERPRVRAEVCTGCHVGDRNRFANHAMMAAGHPRLVFDLETYTELWRTSGGREHYRKRSAQPPSVWVTGILSATRRQFELLEAHAARSVRADFSVYACHTCHRDLRLAAFGAPDASASRAADPLAGAPGELRMQDGQLRLLLVIAEALQLDIRELAAATRRLQAALNREPAQLPAALGEARQQLETVGAELTRRTWSPRESRKVFDAFLRAARSGSFPDPAAAEQAAMGLVMLLAELDLDRARSAEIDALFATLRDDNAFDGRRFRRVLEQLDKPASR
ncbi:MAG: multiheme c-type cytochrome [Nevskiaceae bacterium]